MKRNSISRPIVQKHLYQRQSISCVSLGYLKAAFSYFKFPVSFLTIGHSIYIHKGLVIGNQLIVGIQCRDQLEHMPSSTPHQPKQVHLFHYGSRKFDRRECLGRYATSKQSLFSLKFSNQHNKGRPYQQSESLSLKQLFGCSFFAFFLVDIPRHSYCNRKRYKSAAGLHPSGQPWVRFNPTKNIVNHHVDTLSTINVAAQ